MTAWTFSTRPTGSSFSLAYLLYFCMILSYTGMPRIRTGCTLRRTGRGSGVPRKRRHRTPTSGIQGTDHARAFCGSTRRWEKASDRLHPSHSRPPTSPPFRLSRPPLLSPCIREPVFSEPLSFELPRDYESSRTFLYPSITTHNLLFFQWLSFPASRPPSSSPVPSSPLRPLSITPNPMSPHATITLPNTSATPLK